MHIELSAEPQLASLKVHLLHLMEYACFSTHNKLISAYP